MFDGNIRITGTWRKQSCQLCLVLRSLASHGETYVSYQERLIVRGAASRAQCPQCPPQTEEEVQRYSTRHSDRRIQRISIEQRRSPAMLVNTALVPFSLFSFFLSSLSYRSTHSLSSIASLSKPRPISRERPVSRFRCCVG